MSMISVELVFVCDASSNQSSVLYIDTQLF